jgi:hypothetical protein
VTHRPHLPGILVDLDNLLRPHLAGHRCIDGQWFNPNAGARRNCPTYTYLTEVRAGAEALHASVHEAAHDDAAATAVAEGMTGLTMAELADEDREGWVLTARMAIEALSEWLDIDHVLEARRAATLDRLSAAGLDRNTNT